MTGKAKRPACRCGHQSLLHIPEWVTSPCSRCDCRDYHADPKAPQ